MASKGKFVWYDLNTTDIQAAIAFYTETIGWTTQEWQGPKEGMPPYTMFAVAGQPIGGVMKLPEEAKEMGAPPHWLAHISTPNVDQTAEQAKGLGGKVLAGPMDIPTVGRFAVLQDPFGAVFAAFTPEGDMEVDHQRKQGGIGWNELMTSDIDGALAFYQKLFGWEKTDSMQTDEFRYEMYGHGDNTYGGIGPMPPGVPMSFWLYYANVDDIDSALHRITSKGGNVVNGPMEVPGGGKIAQFADPQGAMFAVYQPGEAQ